VTLFKEVATIGKTFTKARFAEESFVAALFSAANNLLNGNYEAALKDLVTWAFAAVKEFVDILFDCYDSYNNVKE